MRFGLRSTFAFATAAAVFGLFLRTPAVVAIAMLIALPACIALVAITSPQRGTSLDPSARPIFSDLLRLWCFLAIGLAILFVSMLLFPTLQYDLARWRQGDFHSHRFVLTTTVNDAELRSHDRPLPVYDDDGLVGEMHSFYVTVGGPTHIVVSTDRELYPEGSRIVVDAELHENGTIYFRQNNSPGP